MSRFLPTTINRIIIKSNTTSIYLNLRCLSYSINTQHISKIKKKIELNNDNDNNNSHNNDDYNEFQTGVEANMQPNHLSPHTNSLK